MDGLTRAPVALPYGSTQVDLDLSGLEHISILEPRRTDIDPVRLALAAPIGCPRLRELVQPASTIVVIASDVTRPCPTHLLLPAIMEELGAAGVPDENVTVVFALGTHRPHTPEEQARLVGPQMAARLRCLDSDPQRTVFVGMTSRGTPVEVFEPVVQASFRILLGNVEPHYFAGYSGGLKALVPGVCSQRTISHNHALMVDPSARAGVLEGNPVREDIEEAAALVPAGFLLNVVVDRAKNVAAAVAGHPVLAHRWACRVVDYLSSTPIAAPADIVVVSAGGYPKDINMYQAQKALDNAAAAVRDGGVIIWLAACSEGLGNATFESWLVGSSASSILERIQREFVLGGHKAAAIARVLARAAILLVSELPPDCVRACGMEPFPDLVAALQAAYRRLGQQASVVVMPEGPSVLPLLEGRSSR